MKGTVTKLLAVMLSCALLMTHASAEEITDAGITDEALPEAGVTAGADIETAPETDGDEILKAIEEKTDAAIAASDGITPFAVELTDEEKAALAEQERRRAKKAEYNRRYMEKKRRQWKEQREQEQAKQLSPAAEQKGEHIA